jgi:transposase
VGDQWWSRRGGPSIGRGAPLNAELTLIIHEYEDDRVGSLHDLESLIRSSSVVARSKQQQLVADRRRELIEPLIPQRPARRGPGGRPRIDDRAALEGILSCSTPVVAGGIFPRSWAADPGTPRWRQADLVLPPEAAELSSAVAELRRRTNAQELDVLRNLPESRCRDWHRAPTATIPSGARPSSCAKARSARKPPASRRAALRGRRGRQPLLPCQRPLISASAIGRPHGHGGCPRSMIVRCRPSCCPFAARPRADERVPNLAVLGFMPVCLEPLLDLPGRRRTTCRV